MQHATVAQNLAEEVAKVADQLKDFKLRAISAAERGLAARADAALEALREWPPAQVQPELILQFLTLPDVASGLRVCVRWSEAAEAACRLVALRSRARELTTAIDPDYMQRHPQLNFRMRKILVDWLTEAHHGSRFAPETLFITVQIIDEYLAVSGPVLRTNLQLVGVAAIALACTATQEPKPMSLHMLAHITDNAYDEPTILAMQETIAAALADGKPFSSIRTFMMSYLKTEGSENDCYMVWLASYVAERMLLEHKMLKYPPSMVAACAVYVARGSLDQTAWTLSLRRCSQYSADDLQACLEDVKRFVVDCAPAGFIDELELTVHRKYRNRRLGAPAMIPIRMGEWSHNFSLYHTGKHFKKPPVLYSAATEAEFELELRLHVPRMWPWPREEGRPVTARAPREPQQVDPGSCATM